MVPSKAVALVKNQEHYDGRHADCSKGLVSHLILNNRVRMLLFKAKQSNHLGEKPKGTIILLVFDFACLTSMFNSCSE